MNYFYNVNNFRILASREWLIKGVQKSLNIANADLKKEEQILKGNKKGNKNMIKSIQLPRTKSVIVVTKDLRKQLDTKTANYYLPMLVGLSGKAEPLFNQVPVNFDDFSNFIISNGHDNFNYRLDDDADFLEYVGNIVLLKVSIEG